MDPTKLTFPEVPFAEREAHRRRALVDRLREEAELWKLKAAEAVRTMSDKETVRGLLRRSAELEQQANDEEKGI